MKFIKEHIKSAWNFIEFSLKKHQGAIEQSQYNHELYRKNKLIRSNLDIAVVANRSFDEVSAFMNPLYDRGYLNYDDLKYINDIWEVPVFYFLMIDDYDIQEFKNGLSIDAALFLDTVEYNIGGAYTINKDMLY